MPLLHDIRTADNIADRATEALWQDPFLDPQGLELAVENGVVTLFGAAIDPAVTARAAEIIIDLPGVEAVVDGTTQPVRLAA